MLRVIAFLIPTLCIGQGSLNLQSTYQYGKPSIGVSGVLEDRRFLFEGQILGNQERLTGVIKAGVVLAGENSSRFIIGPKLTSNIRTNEFVVSINPELNFRSNRFTFSAGADLRLKKEKAFMQNETTDISYDTYNPRINLNAAIQYTMYGKRYNPHVEKFEHNKVGLNWWDAGALVLGTVSAVGRGTMNALRKDQGSLQRYLGVGDYDFGGKNDWERNYENNRYKNEDGSYNAHKSEIIGNFGRDAWHTADEMSKWGDRVGSACFIVGSAIEVCKVANQPYKSPSAKKRAIRKKVFNCALKGAALWAVSSVIENKTYESITTAK
jgi:hypothetical protein